MNNSNSPLAYMITWRTYATWFHGDARKSVGKYHNVYLTPKLKPNATLEKSRKKLCKEAEFIMNIEHRQTVLHSIIKTAEYANWHLFATHVRANHVHIVVSAPKKPEKLSISFKAYATRYLDRAFPELNREKYWSQGSSTKYIFQTDHLLRAIQYTIEEQGTKMAVYCEPSYKEILSTLGETHNILDLL